MNITLFYKHAIRFDLGRNKSTVRPEKQCRSNITKGDVERLRRILEASQIFPEDVKAHSLKVKRYSKGDKYTLEDKYHGIKHIIRSMCIDLVGLEPSFELSRALKDTGFKILK